MGRLKVFILFFISVSFFLISCKQDSEKKGTTGKKLEVIRFDQLLMTLDTTDIQGSFSELTGQYPEFSGIFFSKVMPFQYEEKSDSFYFYLKSFITDKRIREVYQMVQNRFGDFNRETLALSQAFEKAMIWFPTLVQPRIYTYISEFSLQQFIFEDHDRDGLALGLDLFLDGDFNYTRLEQGQNTFARYLTRTYDQDHLVKKTLDAWIEDQMGTENGNRLIDQMIYNGKKLYLLEQIIDEPDSILLEYTGEQLDWIINNEREMWAFYLENNWFYTTDQYVIKRLVFPSPNSTAIGMPAGAPGQTGNYLGWKIVNSYMKRHPETNFEQLMEIEAQRLLELSKFKPGIR